MAKQAIEAPRTNIFSIAPEDLTLITDPKNPLYDPRVERPVREGLVISMMANGFRSVITAYKDGDKVVVSAGRGRVKAAREANKRLKKAGRDLIACKVLMERGTESDHLGMSLVENTNREDESDLGLAKKLKRLVDMGATEEAAGATCGLTAPQTKTIFTLLDLAAPIQKAVEAGKISTTAAAKLAKLDREGQIKALDELLAESGGKRVRVAKVARKVKGKTAPTPTKKEVKALAAWSASKAGAGGLPAQAEDVLKWVLEGNAEGCVKNALAEVKVFVEGNKSMAAALKADAKAKAKLAREAKKTEKIAAKAAAKEAKKAAVLAKKQAKVDAKNAKLAKKQAKIDAIAAKAKAKADKLAARAKVLEIKKSGLPPLDATKAAPAAPEAPKAIPPVVKKAEPTAATAAVVAATQAAPKATSVTLPAAEEEVFNAKTGVTTKPAPVADDLLS